MKLLPQHPEALLLTRSLSCCRLSPDSCSCCADLGSWSANIVLFEGLSLELTSVAEDDGVEKPSLGPVLAAELNFEGQLV